MVLENIEINLKDLQNITSHSEIICSEEDFFSCGEDVAVKYRCFSEWASLSYSAEFFEMLYVPSGKCRIITDREDIELETGNICIVAPETKRSVICTHESTTVYSIIIRRSTFEREFFSMISDRDVLAGFFRRALQGRPEGAYIIFRTAPDTQLKVIAGHMLNEYQQDEDYKNRCMVNLLQGLLIVLLRHHEQKVIVPTENKMEGEEELFAILNYINTNYADISAESLASHFGFSTRHMSRLIKKGSTMSIGELIRTTRLLKAAQMLEISDTPVDEIALQVGYAEHSGFHRAFKQYYGMTPAEYRLKCENLKRYAEGEQLINLVDPVAGY